MTAIYLPTIPEFHVSTHDRGVPNSERIVIVPNMTVDMSQFLLILGARAPGTDIYQPIPDKLFWFGSGTVTANDRLFVYTGPGEVRKTSIPDRKDLTAFVLHWGSTQTLLADPSISPLIVQISAMNSGTPRQLDLPQFTSPFEK